MACLLMAALSVTLPVPVHAQQGSQAVTGTVRDNSGQPVIGATVLVKGTNIGTTVGLNGAFSVNIPEETGVLVVSRIGNETVEVTVRKGQAIDVVLEEASSQIEDVVVVGYGVQKKASVTGAISTVDLNELQKSTMPSLATALAGHVSGLTSSQMGGGQPGMDESTMYLRGAATLNGQSPLVLIDGVPRDNIRTIDPSEVESVSVLKDASATAVFGVRGANGVIIITTRRGKEGTAKLSLSYNQTFSSFAYQPSRLHSLEYLDMRNQALGNDGQPLISQDIISMYENPLQGLDPSDPDYASKAAARQHLYPDNDHYRALFKKWAPQINVNANLAGGTDRLSYFVNAGLISQDGHFRTQPKSTLGYDPSSRMQRWSFRSNVDYQITKKLKAYLNLGSYIEKVGMPSIAVSGNNPALLTNIIFFNSALTPPISPGPTTIAGHGAPAGATLLPNDVYGQPLMGWNAYEYVNTMGYTEMLNSNLNSTIGIDWDLGAITKGLSFKGMVSYDSYSSTTTIGNCRTQRYALLPGADANSFSYMLDDSQVYTLVLYTGASSWYKINAQAILMYNNSFGKHTVGGTIVAQRDNWESAGVDDMPYNVLGVAGRVTYNYDNRYFGEFNMGYNGSEQFAPGKRYGFFPAGSLSWIVSNEKFMSGSRVLTMLKLRASAGKVGNDKQTNAATGLANRFMYMDQTERIGGGYLPSLGQGHTINEKRLGNPNLVWETATKYNVGVDFGFWGRLTGSVDFYREFRKDILIPRQSVPSVIGVPASTLPSVNIAQVNNQGVDMELAYNQRIGKDWNVTVRGNLGLNKNMVIYADEVPLGEDYAYRWRRTGYSLGQDGLFGYVIDRANNGGYFTPETLASNTLNYTFGTPRVGDFIYKDLNGDGDVDEEDLAPLGTGTIPRRTYGLSLSAQYKNLDFSIFFQGLGGYYGNYTVNNGNQVFEYNVAGTYFDYHKNAWTLERWENGEKITYPALSTKSNTNHKANSFFIQDKSFIRLKNIELGYTLPEKWMRKLNISKARVYVGAENLVTWSKLDMDHLDPETTDPMAYPLLKTVRFGVNVSF